MDPISAFSLAGTIVNFLDIGTKLAVTGWRIYRSSEGLTGQDGTDLTKAVSRFAQIAKELAKTQKRSAIGTPEDNLRRLADEIQDSLAKAIERLKKIGLFAPINPGKRESLSIAARRLTHSSEIEQLENQMSSFRQQLSMQLLSSLWHFSTQSLEDQVEVIKALKIANIKADQQHTTMQSILQRVTEMQESKDSSFWQFSIEGDFQSAIYEESPRPGDVQNMVFLDKTRAFLEEMILTALKYKEMDERQVQITSAYEKTFRWALKKPNGQSPRYKSLADWFEDDDPIYWITGKPGAGKSTLMKYLSYGTPEDTKVWPFLKRWAGKRETIIAAFYFWAVDPGPLQRSRRGLLRTLLYRLLRIRPDVLPIVFPQRWEASAMIGFHEKLLEWGDAELHESLLLTIKLLQSKGVCICFFIDGLDEFEGLHADIIRLVLELSKTGRHVKLCVAGRPEIEYAEALANVPQLRVQDLTYEDIKLFVTTELQSHPQFPSLSFREPQFTQHLIESIVSKASGIFLWVSLVVRSLKVGLYQGDRIKDLQQTVNELPEGLHNLYTRILEKVDHRYAANCAEMILLMETTETALPLLLFAFAEEGSVKWLKSLSTSSPSADAVAEYTRSTYRRLISRWKGLIELDKSQEEFNGLTTTTLDPQPFTSVRYLHKTVREFVQSQEMKAFLIKNVPKAYNPYLQLCIASAAMSRLLDTTIPDVYRAKLFEDSMFRYARQLQGPLEPEAIEILDSVNQNIRDSQYKLDQIEGSSSHKPRRLTLAARHGVLFYLIHLAAYIQPSEINNLLVEALTSLTENCETICWLLGQGADPSDYAAVSALMRHLHTCERVSTVSALEVNTRKCLVSFIAHGAKMWDLRALYSGGWPETFVKELERLTKTTRSAVKVEDTRRTSFTAGLYSRMLELGHSSFWNWKAPARRYIEYKDTLDATESDEFSNWPWSTDITSDHKIDRHDHEEEHGYEETDNSTLL